MYPPHTAKEEEIKEYVTHSNVDKDSKIFLQDVTLHEVEEDTNKLLQDVNGGSREEALPDSNSIFHTLATKACVISTKSGLTMQRLDPSGLLLFLRLKSKTV